MIPASTAAVMAAAGFLIIVVFQVALALGAPLGRAAWGGRHDRLPSRLRVGSAIAALIWLTAMLIVLDRAGVVTSPLPGAVVAVGTWILVGLSAVGAIVNVASSSRFERFGWGPLAAILALLCLVVALGGDG